VRVCGDGEQLRIHFVSQVYGRGFDRVGHKGYIPGIAERYGKDPARMPFDFRRCRRGCRPRAVFVNAPLQDGNFDVAAYRCGSYLRMMVDSEPNFL
jgi:hypothetical protein